MRKYIAPELEVVNFSHEDIMTLSGGSTQQNVLTVDTNNGGVATFTNGSLDFTDNH